jgi:tetratricopeptide (TPR) repeat protein
VVLESSELARTVALDLLARATSEEQVNHWQNAEFLFARVVDADHTLLDGYLGVARMFLRRGLRGRAELALRSAYPSAVVSEESLVRWAKSLAEMGFVQGALDALAPSTQSARALRVMAEVCIAAGRLPEALAYARRSLELNDDDPASQRQARQLVRALSMLVAELDPVRYVSASAPPLRRLLAR